MALFTSAALGAQTTVVDRLSVDLRVSPYLAYDSARERVVSHGDGYGRGSSETWEWDGSEWRRRSPRHAPRPSWGHALAYVAPGRATLLFGGFDSFSRKPMGDTWAWDGEDWRQLLPSQSPSARAHHAMAYDSTRRRLVLFGGTEDLWNRSMLADTWEWDGSTWALRSPAQHPPAMQGHSMAFDPLRGRVVLVGGDEIWEWDGKDWARQSPARRPPNPDHRAITYDPNRQRIVLIDGDGDGLTWEWDGRNWSSTRNPGMAAGRSGNALVFDGARGELLLFDENSAQRPETWTLDDSAWTLRHVGDGNAAPGTAAYDTRRGVLVSSSVHHVSDRGWPPQSISFQSTREWDGQRWRRIAHVQGSSTFAGPMVFDSKRNVTVMYNQAWSSYQSGCYQITREWDGKTWRTREDRHDPNSGRSGYAIAYDSRRGRTVLFGGASPVFTKEWDGTNWSEIQTTTAPSARTGHAMAYDELGDRVILHGGRAGHSVLGDTWQWDGKTWQKLTTYYAPPPASDHPMAWDPSRKKVVVYAGDGLWELDGSYWRKVAGLLPAPNGSTMAYDAVRKALIVIGSQKTRWIGSVAQPSSRPVGSGCGGSVGVPMLTSAAPRLGDSHFRLVLDGAPPSAPAVIAVSDTQQTVPLGGGCSLYLGGTIVPFSTVSSVHGHAEATASIRFQLALRGLTFFAQAGAFDRQTNRLVWSAGLRLAIGD